MMMMSRGDAFSSTAATAVHQLHASTARFAFYKIKSRSHLPSYTIFDFNSSISQDELNRQQRNAARG
jgi:hypothetical protein